MFQAILNNRSYEVLSHEDSILVNGEPLDWNIAPVSEGRFHILYKDKSYRAEVVKIDSILKSILTYNYHSNCLYCLH